MMAAECEDGLYKWSKSDPIMGDTVFVGGVMNGRNTDGWYLSELIMMGYKVERLRGFLEGELKKEGNSNE